MLVYSSLPPPQLLIVFFVFVRPNCTDTTMYGLRFMYFMHRVEVDFWKRALEIRVEVLLRVARAREYTFKKEVLTHQFVMFMFMFLLTHPLLKGHLLYILSVSFIRLYIHKRMHARVYMLAR